MPLLDVSSLSVSYGDKIIIKDATFTIQKGDFVCLIGENGSGKTTLIRTILGFIKPHFGSIKSQAQKIGYLPQEQKFDLDFPATVSEVIFSGTLTKHPHPRFSSAQRSAVQTAVKTLRISALLPRQFTSLSGGQKQKVLLARALASKPDLLILDEPSNNLDTSSKTSFYDTLRELNRSGLTILMITHDLSSDILSSARKLELKGGIVQC